MVTFPIDPFLVGSDLAPVQNRVAEFAEGLLGWKARAEKTGTRQPPKLSVEANGFRSGARQDEPAIPDERLGRRFAPECADRGAGRLDPQGNGPSARVAYRQDPAARRHRYRRDAGGRPRPGRRPAGISAGFDRGHGRHSRSGSGARQVPGDFRQHLPRGHRQWSDCAENSPQLGFRVAWTRSAAPRRGEHRAGHPSAAAECRGRACPASARWRCMAACATPMPFSRRTKTDSPTAGTRSPPSIMAFRAARTR